MSTACRASAKAVICSLALAAALLVAATPAAALDWPGGSSVSVVDGDNVFGDNLSGLTYQPSGSSAPGVLWAVKNGPPTLYRLVYDGTIWAPDASGGWGAGKDLRYPDGVSGPDSEGVTLASGDANGVYVATESAGGPSRPGILRYDVSAPGATLVATADWHLTDLPGLGANAGPEAVTWIPDDVLVSKGFLDEATGAAYNPATYADHGAGLFFVGVEQDGRVLAYALGGGGSFVRVATIASGFAGVMGLEYEPDTARLWAVCDDTCSGQSATLDVAQEGANDGKFVVTATYDRPAGMPDLNNEGFAIAPQAECASGLKPAFWAEDNIVAHALRAGTLNCPVPAPPPVGQPPTTPPVTPPPAPPVVTVDRTAPQLRIAIKFARSGTFAVRRTGKFGAVISLGERANLIITATARKTARARARTILRTTRRGVAAGKATLTLKLSRRVREALGKGETVTLTVKASDAAGNAVTKRATGKVR